MKGFLSSLFGVSDEQAMWRVQTEDDPQAFAHLMRKWEAPIQRLCTRMTCDTHKAEDLAQEAFARLYAKRRDWQPSGKVSTYLWRIALNVCYDELRRSRRRPESRFPERENGDDDFVEQHAVDDTTPADALATAETADKVRAALARLPEHYRTVVVMRHYENLKFQEIAEILEIPEGTAKSRMAQGLAQLHRFLAKDFLCPKNENIRRESLIL